MFLTLCYQNNKDKWGGGDTCEDPRSEFFTDPNVIDKNSSMGKT